MLSGGVGSFASLCVFVCEREREVKKSEQESGSESRGAGEAICIKRLITCRVNQPCSLSVAELRGTPRDNQRRGEVGEGEEWGEGGGLKWREGDRMAY